ncbi:MULTISPECIES: HDOD domain-containing protein [unclassified Dehalobacter]|uniref:EAL and HDOD domain-containing protein n=1 Tax=unclassified Dehalobacter TaxID=2635733 RepID=UPI000E6C3C42|nr:MULTISPECIES: HDOD domain-containing protein [unclassified Dehalobacter]RJE47984.1 diguanylate phosphodiesterase [Dehalobacter sp. MCB1]TCX50608.1 diguanylate phosphodiesterase [Dehalobacter sp. 14DCB1]TCX52148.1 diguanylate phosphodiesterase [Dehalobacter sp. 12DCB1]
MDVFIARQPIFDRNLHIYGYELLYRQGQDNSFSGIDDDRATAELIYNSFLVFGIQDLTDDAKAFINFSKDLVDSDIPSLLPNHNVVLEILERKKVAQSTVEACKRVREMGYLVALDDFVFDQSYLPLIETADIIKIEYPAVNEELQRKLIKKFHTKVKFVAEKIETREEFQRAYEMGYDYFQGYFFSKPSIINSKEIVSLNSNILKIIQELKMPEPSYAVIGNIVQSDLGLTYKIFKLANSIYLGTKNKINSIPQALAHLGLKELYRWSSIIMLKDLQNIENAELIKLSLIRGKLMELLASELGDKMSSSEFFFTGMFSSIDILLNKSMEQVLHGLSLPDHVKLALLGQDNKQRRLLNFIIDFENAQWSEVENQNLINKLGIKRFMLLYVEAIKWTRSLDY